MKVLPLAALFIAVSAAAAGAQLYRWVDDNGRVEWRDTPPPAEAKNVERRTVGGNTVQTSTLPYSLQVAVKKHPVTLWVFDCGDLCTSARNHLVRRGVPHTERNPAKDGDALKKLTGSLEVPVLTVGSSVLKGYLDTDWDAALDGAGYPRTPAPGVKAHIQADKKADSQAVAAKADAAAAKARPQAPGGKTEASKPAAGKP